MTMAEKQAAEKKNHGVSWQKDLFSRHGTPLLPLREIEIRTLVVGTGAAGYGAAVRLHQFGERSLAVVAENVKAGTSRNTGSDKQTYYKLSLCGGEPDSIRGMAEDLFRGQCVDGDLALCEAALSAKCFYYLEELGVPFPNNEYGEYIGYQTDHDNSSRASSVGPYTSRIMTECLERETGERGIPVMDHMQMIQILVRGGKLCGVLCLNQKPEGQDETVSKDAEFVLIWCRNLVLATGGPAGMYRHSVYPASQLGSSGLAFEAGIRGKNLTEWQFGMASLHPRWNVSGTYMQALPRFVSTNEDGGDEREFLLDYFQDPARLQSATFLKGYQWPFDSGRIWGGSSLLDLLVYQETVLKKRRVFLDFMHNPGQNEVDFDRLSDEAQNYLAAAGACFGTPIERLWHMNGPAVSFYLEHGVDLRRQMLEIAVCAQHNNGGLATDAHWQTNIEGIYAVGEVCGSHGVSRPGGSALNAGQAGAVRAAEHIAFVRNAEDRNISGRGQEQTESAAPYPGEADRAFCRKKALRRMELLHLSGGNSNLGEIWKRAAGRMSAAAGMIRSEEGLSQALKETEEELNHFSEKVRVSDLNQAGMLYHLLDMLTAQKVYLSAMLDYIRRGGGSRGSALYTCPDGDKPDDRLPEHYRCRKDDGGLGGMVQEIWLKLPDTDKNMCWENSACEADWRPVRPIPEADAFFETQWKAFRDRRGI